MIFIAFMLLFLKSFQCVDSVKFLHAIRGIQQPNVETPCMDTSRTPLIYHRYMRGSAGIHTKSYFIQLRSYDVAFKSLIKIQYLSVFSFALSGKECASAY